MRSESSQEQENVLLFIDDSDMQIITNVVLSAENRRLLMARDTVSALWILRNWRIGSIVIREGIDGFRPVQLDCLKRGVNVYLMTGVVEAGIVRLRLPSLEVRTAGLASPARP